MFLKLSLYRNPYKYRNVSFFFEKEALVSCVRTTLTDRAKGGLRTTFLEEESVSLPERSTVNLPSWNKTWPFLYSKVWIRIPGLELLPPKRTEKINVREKRILNNILHRINFWTPAKDISLARKPMELMLSSHHELYTFSKHKSPQPFMNAHSLHGSPWLCL